MVIEVFLVKYLVVCVMLEVVVSDVILGVGIMVGEL